MVRRFLRETGRLCRAKQTWLLIAVMVFGPILTAIDFFEIGNRVYDTTISNVLMLNPARVSLYISAFSIMVFTLLQLKQLYSGGAYTIIETTVNPVTQILRQTLAICVITVASLCVALLVLYPYTALTMKELFSFAKFIRTWAYVYLLGLLITVLLTSGVFLIFRSFEVSLILMSALMLFSISRPVESYYLTHWLQTSVTSLADGTESTLRFKIMLYTRLVGVLVGIGAYALGLLCVRRYARGILGSALKNVRHATIPLLLVVCIVTSTFCVNHDPLYWKDVNDPTLLEGYVVDTKTETIVADESDSSEYNIVMHAYEEEFNLDVQWEEMTNETTIVGDRLYGKGTYLIDNLSEGLEEQQLTIRTIRGIEPIQVFCNAEPLDFCTTNFNYMDWYCYHFTLPAGLESATLEILFEGSPRGSQNSTDLDCSVTKQYVELSMDYVYLMTLGTSVFNYTINLPKNLTLLIPGTEVKEIAPTAEGYRTYAFTDIHGEGILYYYIYAGDYCMETTNVGDLEIQFLYFENKEKIMKKIGAIDVIKDAVAYFTDLYGPLELKGNPLIVAETEIDLADSWQLGNLCGIAESAIVSSLYQADPEDPNASRSAGLQSLVEAIAQQWWDLSGYGAIIELDWDYNLEDAFVNYSTYLYIKHLYGEVYADKALKESWYQIAKFQQNEFYRCNKQYISVLPLEDAIEIYLPYQAQEEERECVVTAALFHAEELIGEEALIEALKESYNESKGGEEAYLEGAPVLTNAMFLGKLAITQEEFEAW